MHTAGFWRGVPQAEDGTVTSAIEAPNRLTNSSGLFFFGIVFLQGNSAYAPSSPDANHSALPTEPAFRRAPQGTMEQRGIAPVKPPPGGR